MTKHSSILVIAPSEELRRSITFALEAEGLPVESFPDLPSVSDAVADASACAIVDENAVLSDQDGWLRLAALPRVILLIDRLPSIPERYAVQAVRKPLLGRQLIDLVLPSAALGRH